MVLSCQAGEKAVSCGVTNADSINELSDIKDLHLRSGQWIVLFVFPSVVKMLQQIKVIFLIDLYVYLIQDSGGTWSGQRCYCK
jgi:hypothetical protein